MQGPLAGWVATRAIGEAPARDRSPPMHNGLREGGYDATGQALRGTTVREERGKRTDFQPLSRSSLRQHDPNDSYYTSLTTQQTRRRRREEEKKKRGGRISIQYGGCIWNAHPGGGLAPVLGNPCTLRPLPVGRKPRSCKGSFTAFFQVITRCSLGSS